MKGERERANERWELGVKLGVILGGARERHQGRACMCMGYEKSEYNTHAWRGSSMWGLVCCIVISRVILGGSK